MDPPILNVPGEISFFMQAGLEKDTVSVDISELTLKTLKDLACNFIDRKVRANFVVFANLFPSNLTHQLQYFILHFLHLMAVLLLKYTREYKLCSKV